MTDETPEEQLDPDQIVCRKCEADVGLPCRQPNGAKAREIHTIRRRDALAGNRPQLPDKREPRGPSPATDEGRSKGGRKTAQERRRRKSELAAAVEQARAEAEAEAIQREAEKLARDASKYATDRADLRRLTLRNAMGIAKRLDEAVTHLHRPKGYADDGKPLTMKVELFHPKTGLPVFDEHGERVFEEVPEVVGWTSVSMVETLSKAAAQQLASVRLEEGKPTGIHEHLGGPGAAELLGDREVRELVNFAHEFYSDKEGPTT